MATPRPLRIVRRAAMAIAIAFTLFANYVLSEAPVYRIFGSQTGAPTGNNYRYYVFADLLMDNTFLRGPLLLWADWWGVREEFDFTGQYRRGER